MTCSSKIAPIPLEDRFSYHAPTTQERLDAHNEINNATKDLALLIDRIVEDPTSKRQCYDYIQMVRMFANQGVTFDEIRRNDEGA